MKIMCFFLAFLRFFEAKEILHQEWIPVYVNSMLVTVLCVQTYQQNWDYCARNCKLLFFKKLNFMNNLKTKRRIQKPIAY